MQSPDQAFAPLASSESTLAEYKNPFGFSLQIVEAGETIVLGANGNNAAQVSKCPDYTSISLKKS